MFSGLLVCPWKAVPDLPNFCTVYPLLGGSLALHWLPALAKSKLDKDKRSSLFGPFISYKERFIKLAPETNIPKLFLLFFWGQGKSTYPLSANANVLPTTPRLLVTR